MRGNFGELCLIWFLRTTHNTRCHNGKVIIVCHTEKARMTKKGKRIELDWMRITKLSYVLHCCSDSNRDSDGDDMRKQVMVFALS